MSSVKPVFDRTSAPTDLVKRQGELVRQVGTLPPGKQRDELSAELDEIKRQLALLGYRHLPEA
jgi:hypothetical protein